MQYKTKTVGGWAKKNPPAQWQEDSNLLTRVL